MSMILIFFFRNKNGSKENVILNKCLLEMYVEIRSSHKMFSSKEMTILDITKMKCFRKASEGVHY